MTEILWHGRGGQGAFTAARLLGAAASLDDAAFALAFPSFGPERRGAPIRAFTKISDSQIGDRSAIEQADFVIYLDETLFDEGWQEELAPGGRVLLNAQAIPAIAAGDERVMVIDANAISADILGRPIPNTVFLGVLAALGVLPLENVERSIELYMPAKLHDSNKKIVQAAFDIVKSGRNVSDQQADACASETFAAASQANVPVHPQTAVRPDCIIPTLQKDELDPAEFARSTCFAGGHLVDKNAGWRNVRPVIDEAKCIGCLQCYLYCPDGTVFKKEPAQGSRCTVAIDYDFCKGCGMCVNACKSGAIVMIPESEAI